MKLHIKILLSALLLSATTALAEPRGWGAGLGVFEGDFGIHARKDFMFGKELQYGVALQGGLYNQNKWTTRLDADFHYIFTLGSAFRLYPLAGVDLAIQSKNNRIGGNLGGGAMVDLNTDTRLFMEAKYVTGDWDGFAFTAGIYF
ncbi:hypothetical protein P4B35_19035 [Pontiellaceae bacterium B12227]|nr:hypothetical protein [Pontiellaceae bacterium B12227]